jgi:hypothetical protein
MRRGKPKGLKRGTVGRDLRRTSIYLDGTDREYLARLVKRLGLWPSEVLRIALREYARKYTVEKE